MSLQDVARREAYKFMWRTAKRKFSSLEQKLFGPPSKRARAGRPLPGPSDPTNAFNAGYYIVNRKARNSKRRRRYSKKLKVRSMKRNKARLAGISGKLLSRMWKKVVLLNEMENNRGKLGLVNDVNASGRHFLPCHIFDITAVDNRYVGLTSGYTDGLGLNVVFDTTASANSKMYSTDLLPIKLNSDGETASNLYGFSNPNWVTVSDTNNDLSNTTKLYHRDVKIELMMYGQKDQDTLYRVDVVMFDPKWVEMLYTTEGDTPPQTHAADTRDWNQFWHALISPYTQNPLVKKPRGKYMKILKSYKFKIPEQSGDYEQQPCVKTKINIPMNRVRNLHWHTGVGSQSAATMDPEDPAGFFPDDDTDANSFGQGRIHPRSRVFLMIRATNTTKGSIPSDGTYGITKGEQPTYDMTINSRFYVNV